MTRQRDMRSYQRYPLTGGVSIAWQDGQGAFRVLNAQGIDISETGLQIESAAPIQAGNPVTVRSERCGLTATASVRYCRAPGSRYRLGLEFIGGWQWRPPVPPTDGG